MAISRIESNSIAPSQTLTTPIIATTMGVGGATPAGSGSGITFPASQSASTDANTLDDYEEGTWTPTLTGSSSSPTGVTYGSRQGTYTKVGNLCTVTFYIVWTTYTGGSGNIQVSGLPFSAGSGISNGYSNGAVQINQISLASGQTYATARTKPSSAEVELQQMGSGTNWTSITFGAISSGASSKEILTTITYFVS